MTFLFSRPYLEFLGGSSRSSRLRGSPPSGPHFRHFAPILTMIAPAAFSPYNDESRVRTVCLDQRGDLCVGGDSGLFRKKENGFDRLYRNEERLSANFINAICFHCGGLDLAP